MLAVSSENSFDDSASYITARLMGAKACLNSFDSENVKNTEKFINTVSGFVGSFSGSKDERKIAIYLSEYAQEVYYHLNDVSSAVLNGVYSITEYGSIYKNETTPYFEEYVDYSNGNEKELFNAAMPASSTETVSFSEDKITKDEAKEIASLVAGVNPALWRDNESDLGIKVHSFYHGDVSVDISESGRLCRYINPLPCKKAVYSADECENKATEFLVKYGFENMVEAETKTGDFVASFLCYPEINGVLLMTSPVRIEICRASGETVYFEAADYVKNFRANVPKPQDMSDISEVLPENIKAEETRFCLKEIDGREKLCILAVCEFESYRYRLYIDPETLKILKTENA